ncbi:DNA/RNA non-specific endonuclease-like protein [Novymonas esmeraldas]|uniref:DNA/RNA non-specific endonuclease-like protein n=1 Tax=Novymonas esmeraldas TaxID=1808958 RepID=A0AAW0EZG7_9TRYP
MTHESPPSLVTAADSGDGGHASLSMSALPWWTQARRRLLNKRARSTVPPVYPADTPAAPARTASSSPSRELHAPPRQELLWLLWWTCATVAAAGTCGVVVGLRLTSWLHRRTARCYARREAACRNSMWLLPSPHTRTDVGRPAAMWRVDRGCVSEWMAACVGHRWLPRRVSMPTLLRLYSPGCNTRRCTTEEVRWGTHKLHPRLSHTHGAASFFSFAAAAARLAGPQVTPWKPMPQYPVDVFVAGHGTGGEVAPLLCLPRHSFTLLYDPVARLSVWCGYYLTRDGVERARRHRRSVAFLADPSLPRALRRTPSQLVAQWHDRGHLAPHASVATTAQAAVEASLLSNVQLQHRHINRGVWRWLESAVRAYVRQTPPAPQRQRADSAHTSAESTPTETARTTRRRAAAATSSTTATLHQQQQQRQRRRGRRRRQCGPLSPPDTPASCVASCVATGDGVSRRVRADHGQIVARLLADADAACSAWRHSSCGVDGAADDRPPTTAWGGCWWRWWSRRACRTRERQVAIAVGPLYRNASGSAASAGTSRHRTRRTGGTRGHATPAPSLFVPDAFFFSVWDVSTHQHVHLVLPNCSNTAPMPAVAAALRARTAPVRGRGRHRPPPPTSATADLVAALRLLAVPTEELEQLFAASLVELRRRCAVAGASPVPARVDSSDAAVPAAQLRTDFHVFPVYRQRWMWRRWCTRWGRRRR